MTVYHKFKILQFTIYDKFNNYPQNFRNMHEHYIFPYIAYAIQ